MQSSVQPAVSVRQIVSSTVKKVVYRVTRMVFAWMALGALTGVALGWRLGGGGIEIVAQMIAGMITLPLLGGMLGLFFDRAKESLIGGVCGMAVGLISVATNPANLRPEALGVCVIIGALIGSTCWPWLGATSKTFELARRFCRASVDICLRRRTSVPSPEKDHAKLGPKRLPSDPSAVFRR